MYENQKPRVASVLDHVISPSDVVRILAQKGIRISERGLREKARQLGAYRIIGKTMFLTPEDLERIIAPSAPTFRPSVEEMRLEARRAGSRMFDRAMEAESLRPKTSAPAKPLPEKSPPIPWLRPGVRQKSKAAKVANPLAKTEKGRTGDLGADHKSDDAT